MPSVLGDLVSTRPQGERHHERKRSIRVLHTARLVSGRAPLRSRTVTRGFDRAAVGILIAGRETGP